jgi:hypothetical protein
VTCPDAVIGKDTVGHDFVEDPAVQVIRRPDARLRAGGQHGDAGRGSRVVMPRAADLELDERSDRRCRNAFRRRGEQVGPGDAECSQVLLRHVDPVPSQVLTDIPDEVRELERKTELAGRFACGEAVGRTEDRQHHRCR